MSELDSLRQAVVREHMDAENRHDFDAATILRQLGLATDPRSLRGRLETAALHPLTVGAALLRGLRR